MNIEQIRERATNGFRPFVIRLTDGRKFEVPHMEFILVGDDSIAVLGKDRLIHTIDVQHIVSLNPLRAKKQ
jgi:hypothetical protein